MSSDFWLDLYEKYPEIFKVVKYGGKTGLKIITSKFQEKFSQIKEYFKDKKLENLIPLLNSSETKKYLDLININYSTKNKLVKKYIGNDDWTLYMLGKKAKKEKLDLNMEEVIKIKQEAINLRGQRGRIIVNFELQSYFDELIIPLLQYQIKNLKSDSKVIKWFNEFINQIVEFFPMAFWVKNSTTSFEIQKQLIRRCVSYNFKNVNIHTIGKTNIGKIESVLKSLAEDENFPDFNYDIKEDIKGIDVVTFQITLK